MRQKKFDEITTDEYGNVIGKIKGSRLGCHLLFDGHMDTVPADNKEAWKHDPFVPVIEDGKLYGRGTSDMKGAVAAFSVQQPISWKTMEKSLPGSFIQQEWYMRNVLKVWLPEASASW
mgnify:CR=1 FL=1